MSAKAKPVTAVQKEKLHYFVMLRERQTRSSDLRSAYARLVEAASTADGWDVHTVILNWLEAELRTLGRSEDDIGPLGTELMKVTVELSRALAQ